MSGQLRTIKNRIRSVENTKKITHAMEMVAAAKRMRFQDMMVKAKPFTEGLQQVLNHLLEDQSARLAKSRGRSPQAAQYFHPFFEIRDEKRIAVVLFTSDTGLCGSYNTDLVEMARCFLVENQAKQPLLFCVGKIGSASLKRMGFNVDQTFQDMRAGRIEVILKDLKSKLETLYLENQVDSVVVISSHFLTSSAYKGTIEKLLPFKPPADLSQKSRGPAPDYIYEPSPDFVFQKLIPLFFEARVRMIFLESFVSEQIARMTAMQQATENAEEMVDSLVLVRNKVRQAAITKEIIEIISGSQALKIK